jgi:lipopolysaccharide transport system ATP-binding protein
MTDKSTLLSVRNIQKKFTQDIKYNMYYGIKDIGADILGINQNYTMLRKKEFWALKGVDLDLFEGEILGIVGSNGSGKTTLMRLLSGIYPLDVGEIKGLKQQKITAVFALRAGMKNLFSGYENIYIKGAMFGMTKEEIDEKVEFIRDFSELGDKLERPFGNYSSGMGARLAYSIALATDPDIFIIDEALAVGDSLFKAKCFDNLKEYVKQPGKAVLFVSNNIRKILKLATRVLVMDNGEIVYNSSDIKEALNFYILNCLKNVNEKQRQLKLEKVRDYDF